MKEYTLDSKQKKMLKRVVQELEINIKYYAWKMQLVDMWLAGLRIQTEFDYLKNRKDFKKQRRGFFEELKMSQVEIQKLRENLRSNKIKTGGK